MSARIAFEGHQKKAMETARGRLIVGGALMMAAFSAVGLRLVDVAMFSDTTARQYAQSREIVAPRRMGRSDIYDRNGNLLATSLRTASLFADPRKIADPAAAARAIAGVLPELSVTELTVRLSSDRHFVWLRRNLTPRQQYEVNRLGIPGLDFEREERRIYPLGRLTSHVVGFANVDGVGLSGIEKTFDDMLSGRRQPVTLSLDIRVQQIVREALGAQIAKFSAIGGSAVVLDANTGEIVSLVSLPDFDPNDAGTASENARFNRNTLGVYELGSIFKIFNHAIALDTGVVTMGSRYDARRPIRVARFTISDFHAENRWLTVPEVFSYSSNIGSAKMALDIGGETQRKYMSALGLLQPPHIELPEQARPIYPARWRDINTMTISYGHGIAVSPLQAASAVATVVNGGIARPSTLIRRGGDWAEGRQVLSGDTSQKMRRLLRLVVEQGTGRNAAATGYLVGGKTGTAEKQVGGRYKEDALISSFVAAFPVTDPRFIVLVMLDEPKGIKESYGYATGGWTAAPVIRHIISRMAPLYGIAPVDESAPDIRRALAVTVDAPPRKKGRTVATN